MSEFQTKNVENFIGKCPTEGATKEVKAQDWQIDISLRFGPTQEGGSYLLAAVGERFAGKFPDKLPEGAQLIMTYREKFIYTEEVAAKTGVGSCFAIKEVKVKNKDWSEIFLGETIGASIAWIRERYNVANVRHATWHTLE